MAPVPRLFTNNQNPVSMNLMDGNEILFLDVKGGAEYFPVFLTGVLQYHPNACQS